MIADSSPLLVGDVGHTQNGTVISFSYEGYSLLGPGHPRQLTRKKSWNARKPLSGEQFVSILTNYASCALGT